MNSLTIENVRTIITMIDWQPNITAKEIIKQTTFKQKRHDHMYGPVSNYRICTTCGNLR